jgi:hypothetical protein
MTGPETYGRGRGRSTSPRAPTPTRGTEEIRADLAAILGVGTHDLPHVSQDLLDEAIRSMALPLHEKGRLCVALTKERPQNALERHFSEETSQKLYPWKARQEEAVRLFDDLTTGKGTPAEADALRAEFIRRAKTTTLDPIEVLCAAFILFNPENSEAVGGHQLMALLMRVPYNKRLMTYNWWVAGQMPPSTVTAHGSTIANAHGPMFPHVQSLHQLNEKLWAAEEGLSGGGPASITGRGWELIGGAPNLPVQVGTDGQGFVDCAAIAEVTHRLEQNITRQQQELQKTRELLETTKAAAHQNGYRYQQPYYNQQPQHYQHFHNPSQSWRGRGRSNGRGLGRGRGGRGVWGGGEEEETPKNE